MKNLSPSRLAVVSIIFDLLVLGVPFGVSWMLRHRLPERIATHYGSNGQPDGWMPTVVGLIWPLGFGMFMALVLIGLGFPLRSMQILAPASMGVSVLMAVIGYGGALGQLDGGQAAVGPLVFFGVLAMLVVSVLGAWWLKGRMAPIPATDTGTFVPSMPGESSSRQWEGRTQRSKAPVVTTLVVGLVGLGALVLFRSDPWLGASMGLLLLGPLALTWLGNQRVRIDSEGVTATALGLKMHHTPLATILSAGCVHVEPLGDFGGVGFRASHDGTREGLVNAAGDALIFQRRGRKDYVITVDDAQEAARVLANLIGAREPVS